MLCELRPALVHVGSTARIAAKDSVKLVCTVIACHKVPATVLGNLNLVELLVILASIISVCSLCRKSVECHPLQQVSPISTASDLDHLLKREHHLHRRAKLRPLGRVAGMKQLIGSIKSGRPADGSSDVRQSYVNGVQTGFVLCLLVSDNRLLHSLRKVDAMKREQRRQGRPVGQAPCPISGLGSDGVEPIDNVKVVPASFLPPVCPVIERSFSQMLVLVLKILGEESQHPLITSCVIVLFEKFKDNHSRPPVLGIRSLKPTLEFQIDCRPEVTVLGLTCKRPLNPWPRLCLKGFVIKNVRKRNKAVNPVWPPFPHVSVASKPSVTLAHHMRVKHVKMSSQTCGHSLELVFQPPVSLDAAKRQLHQWFVNQRRPVVPV